MTDEPKDLTIEEIEWLLPQGDPTFEDSDPNMIRRALRMARRCAEAEAASKGDMERTAKAIQLVTDAQKRADEWKHLAEEWEATTQKAMARVKELEHEKTEAFVRLSAVKCDTRRQERVALAAASLQGLRAFYGVALNDMNLDRIPTSDADRTLAQLDRTEKEVKPDAK